MTLVLNATTTKALMDVLDMTKISLGRASDMENAYYLLMKTRKSSLLAFKGDRFLLGSVWEVVLSSTKIENPYRDVRHTRATAQEVLHRVVHCNLTLFK